LPWSETPMAPPVPRLVDLFPAVYPAAYLSASHRIAVAI